MASKDGSYGWCFDHSDGLDDFLLVHLRARSVQITNDSGHAGFVSHRSGQVDRLFWIVLGKALDLWHLVSRALWDDEVCLLIPFHDA